MANGQVDVNSLIQSKEESTEVDVNSLLKKKEVSSEDATTTVEESELETPSTLDEYNKKAQEIRPFKRQNNPEDPTDVSTVKMATETFDGENWVSFPTIFPKEDNEGSTDPSDWIDYGEDKEGAYAEAKKRGELFEFGKDKETALKFGEGSWKPEEEKSFADYVSKSAQSVLDVFKGDFSLFTEETPTAFKDKPEVNQGEEATAQKAEEAKEQFDQEGDVDSASEYGYDEKPKEELTSTQSVINTFENAWTQAKKLIPNFQLLSSTIEGKAVDLGTEVYAKIIGEEDPEKIEAVKKVMSAKADTMAKDARQKIDELDADIKETKGIIESVKTGDVAGLAASIFDATSAVVTTAVPSFLTGGVSLYTDMSGNAIKEYNKAKAERLGITEDELYKRGEEELAIPGTIGVVGGLMERAGLKGISKAINRSLAGPTGQKVVGLLWDWNKEGGTELIQLGLETFNKSIGEGKDVIEASKDAWDKMMSDEGLETYAMGVTGSMGMSTAGRAYKSAKKKILASKEDIEAMQKVDLKDEESINAYIQEQIDNGNIEYEKAEEFKAEVIENIEAAKKMAGGKIPEGKEGEVHELVKEKNRIEKLKKEADNTVAETLDKELKETDNKLRKALGLEVDEEVTTEPKKEEAKPTVVEEQPTAETEPTVTEEPAKPTEPSVSIPESAFVADEKLDKGEEITSEEKQNTLAELEESIDALYEAGETKQAEELFDLYEKLDAYETEEITPEIEGEVKPTPKKRKDKDFEAIRRRKAEREERERVDRKPDEHIKFSEWVGRPIHKDGKFGKIIKDNKGNVLIEYADGKKESVSPDERVTAKGLVPVREDVDVNEDGSLNIGGAKWTFTGMDTKAEQPTVTIENEAGEVQEVTGEMAEDIAEKKYEQDVADIVAESPESQTELEESIDDVLASLPKRTDAELEAKKKELEEAKKEEDAVQEPKAEEVDVQEQAEPRKKVVEKVKEPTKEEKEKVKKDNVLKKAEREVEKILGVAKDRSEKKAMEAVSKVKEVFGEDSKEAKELQSKLVKAIKKSKEKKEEKAEEQQEALSIADKIERAKKGKDIDVDDSIQFSKDSKSKIGSEIEKAKGPKKKILKAVKPVIKALSRITPDLAINIHNTPESYAKAVLEAGGTEAETSSLAFYKDGQIHISPNSVKENTLLHEAVHPILNSVIKTNPKFYADLIGQLESHKIYSAYLDKAKQIYKGESTETIENEALTEFLADVSKGKVDLSDKGFAQKVKDFIQSLLKRLGLSDSQVAEFDLDKPANLRQFAQDLSDALTQGKEIQLSEEVDLDKIQPQFQKFREKYMSKPGARGYVKPSITQDQYVEKYTKTFLEDNPDMIGRESEARNFFKQEWLRKQPNFQKAEFEGDGGKSNFDKWKGDNKEYSGSDIQNIKTGEPVVVRAYHGTTNDFYEFDSTVKGSVEGHLGRVNYFTSDHGDASQNYQSGGADITSRIENDADYLSQNLEEEYDFDDSSSMKQLAEDYNIDYSEISNSDSYNVAKLISEKNLNGGDDKVLDVYVKMDNPAVIGRGRNWIDVIPEESYAESLEDATQEISDEYDITIEEAKEDYSYEIRDRAIDMEGIENPLMDALQEAINDNAEGSQANALEILADFTYDNEVDLNQLEKAVREGVAYEYGDEGLVSSQIVSDMFKNLGYDGIILTDVSNRFPNMGLSENMSHIHIFDENANNIKLADGTNTTFDEKTRDIRFQKLSPEEQAKSHLDEISKEGLWDEPGFELDTITEDLVREGVDRDVAETMVLEAYDEYSKKKPTKKPIAKKVEAETEGKASKTAPKVRMSEYALLKKQIKDYAKGWREGRKDLNDTLEAIRDEIRKYASENLPSHELTRGEVKPILTAISKSKNPKDLNNAIEKIDALVEKHLVKGLREKIDKKLDLKNYKEGKKTPKGKKITREDIKLIDKLNKAIQEGKDRLGIGEQALTDSELLELYDLQSNSDQLTDTEIDRLYELTFKQLGDKNLTSTELEQYLDTLDYIIEGGKQKKLAENQKKSEQADKRAAEAVDAITAGEGTKAKSDRETKRRRSSALVDLIDRTKKSFRGTMSSILGDLNWLTTYMNRGKKRDALKWIVDGVKDGRTKENEIRQEKKKAISDKLTELFGSRKKAVDRLNEVAIDKVFKDTSGNPVDLKLTYDETVTLYNYLKDPSLGDTFKNMGWGDEILNTIESTINEDPDVKQYADWIVDEFYPKFYEQINDVYSDVYGIDLPQNSNYTPVKREFKSDSKADKLRGILEANVTQASSMFANLIERKNNNLGLEIHRSSLNTLSNYSDEMARFIGHEKHLRDIQKLFTNNKSDVPGAIANEFGGTFLHNFKSIIDDLRSGRHLKADDQTWNWTRPLRRAFTGASLGANLTLFPKQLTSILAYAGEEGVHMGRWSAELSKSLTQIPSMLTYLTTGKGKAGKELFEDLKTIMNHPDIIDRYDRGFDRDMALIMANKFENMYSGKDKFNKPISMLGKAKRVENSLANFFMLPTIFGDRAAIVMGGLPVYRIEYKKQKGLGKSDAKAKELALKKFRDTTFSSQQSGNIEELSAIQRGNALNKLFTMFKTSPLQYFRKNNLALTNILRGKGTTSDYKRLVVYRMMLPALFQIASQGGFDPEDEDDIKGVLRAFTLGNLNAIPLIGDAGVWIYDKIVGEKNYDLDISPVFSKVERAVGKYAKNPEKYGKIGTDEWMEMMFLLSGSFSPIPFKNIKEKGFDVVQDFSSGEEDDWRRALGYSEYILEGGDKDKGKKRKKVIRKKKQKKK